MKPSYFWRITTFSPLIRFITMLVSWCWSISIVLFQIKMREEQKNKKNITLALYISSCILYHWNHIGSVMVSVLALSAVDHRLMSLDWVKPKTIKLVFVASLLSTQHEGERAKTDWAGIRIMRPCGATCLSADLFLSASTIKTRLSMLV
jgi:hypothetical protein